MASAQDSRRHYLEKPERPAVPVLRAVVPRLVLELFPPPEEGTWSEELVETVLLGARAESEPPPDRPPHHGRNGQIKEVLRGSE